MLKKTVTPAAAIAGIIAGCAAAYATMSGHHGVMPIAASAGVGIVVGFIAQTVMNKD